MRARYIYQEIASLVQARKNCKEAGNNYWSNVHGDCLKVLLSKLPSGSGIDNGVTLDEDDCTSNRLVFSFGFHHMNDGWTDHQLIVTPSFDGCDLRIAGRDRNNVKKYLYDIFDYALNQEVPTESPVR